MVVISLLVVSVLSIFLVQPSPVGAQSPAASLTGTTYDRGVDTDDDGIGNNADEDDDDDGMPDSWEIEYEINPLIDDAQNDPDGDGITNLEEYLAGTDPYLSSYNHRPQQPVLQLPDNGGEVNLAPLLQTEAYDDPDANDFHAQSRWQVFREHDDVCVLDIRTDVSLTSLHVPMLILTEDASYRWRIRFYDNHGAPSLWSEFYTFETLGDLNDYTLVLLFSSHNRYIIINCSFARLAQAEIVFFRTNPVLSNMRFGRDNVPQAFLIYLPLSDLIPAGTGRIHRIGRPAGAS